MRVSEWLCSHEDAIVTVRPECSLATAVERLLTQCCLRDLYVMGDDGRLTGRISHRRLAQHVLAEHQPEHTRRQLMERVAGAVAGDFMDGSFAYASPDEELEKVLHRQLEQEVEDMPVIDADGRLLGAVNLTSVLREWVRAEQAGLDAD